MSSSEMIEEVFQAAQSGEAAHVKQLVESDKSLANAENKDGLTLLGYAAHFGQVDTGDVSFGPRR